MRDAILPEIQTIGAENVAEIAPKRKKETEIGINPFHIELPK